VSLRGLADGWNFGAAVNLSVAATMTPGNGNVDGDFSCVAVHIRPP
jgi:hypothetical protein